MNLVANAFQFTKKGIIEIKISEFRIDTLLIEVNDTGIGMTTNQLMNIQKYINTLNVKKNLFSDVNNQRG